MSTIQVSNPPYNHIPIRECGEPLLDLRKFSLQVEPAYFLNKLSKTPEMFSRQGIIEKLLRIQETKLVGCQFKIWDAWRPREVQANIYNKYWNELKEKNGSWTEERLKAEVAILVTSPDTPGLIPAHSTGGAIDLTLSDSSGKELDMGTGFDHFGPEAAPFYFEAPDKNTHIRENRRLLREAMFSEGFRIDSDEWWHFDYGNQVWAADSNNAFAIYGEKLTTL